MRARVLHGAVVCASRCRRGRRSARSTRARAAGSVASAARTFTAKELELVGSFRFHQAFTPVVHRIVSGILDVTPMIGRQCPVSEADAAFHSAVDRTAAMKVRLGLD